MPPFLQNLYSDHERIRKMLEGLVELLDARDRRGEAPDATIDFGMTRWMEYLDDNHHRREEHLYSQLRSISPETAREAESLSRQHSELERHMHGLVELFSDKAQNNEQKPGEACRAMVDHYIQHLQWEEKIFFPLAIRALRKNDWQRIEEAWEREMAQEPWKQMARNVAMESFEAQVQKSTQSDR